MDTAHLPALLAVILSRATERLLLVGAGALAIYLGYRLFAAIPAATTEKSEGRFTLPGGVSLVLTRVGPGVFFALFGATIIGYSVTRPVEFRIPVELASGRVASGDAVAAGGVIQYSGLGQTSGPGQGQAVRAAASLPPAVVVGRLNSYFDEMRQRLDRVAAAELEAAVRAAKLAVMLGAWKAEWGDREAFVGWVAAGAEGDPPTDRAAGAVVVFATSLR